MGIRDHIERRQTDPAVTPIVERRGGTERREEARLPRWRQWTAKHECGKDLTGRAA